MGKKRALADIAGPQWRVITTQQLHAAGFTDKQIWRRVQDGILHPIFRGVYAYGIRRVNPKGYLLAAQFACGPAAYITGRTALGIAGAKPLYLGSLEVAVTRRIRPRAKPLAVQKVSEPRADEVRTDGALRFATVPRALVDAAGAGAQTQELTRLITQAIRRSRLQHDDMAAVLAAHPESVVLHAAYADYLPDASAKSGLERAFDAALRERSHIPDPERNIHIEAGGIRWEIDRYWRDARLAVELQGGPYHSATPDRVKDELKAAKLIGIGIQLLVITDLRFELEPDAVLGDLETSLAERTTSLTSLP